MERNDIIKALECFHQRILNTDLAEKITESEMMAVFDALSLIKELTEENERLENALIEQSAENIMLCGEVKHARADTVRKMQSEIEKRCIEGGIYPAFVKSTIDQIAKEMTGEKND